MFKKILIVLVMFGIGAFSYRTISPLFIDKVVEDELDPEIAALLGKSTTEEATPIETVNSAVVETSTPAPGAEPTTLVSEPFSIIDTPGHAAAGDVRLIQTPEETILRYENYAGTNGPDLKVYLTNDLDATNFVSLGEAKGNQGNINYTVPNDIDIDKYKYVVTWCEAFGVLFDYAQIN